MTTPPSSHPPPGNILAHAQHGISPSSPLGQKVLEELLIEVRRQKAKRARRRCQLCAAACVLLVAAAAAVTASLRKPVASEPSGVVSSTPEISFITSSHSVDRVQPILVERVQSIDSQPILITTEPGISTALAERIGTNELMELLASRGGGIISLSNGEKIAAVVD